MTAAAGPALAACGDNGASGSSSGELSVLFPYNTTQERDALVEQIKAYDESSGTTTNVQNSSWDDIDELIQTRVAAGDYPGALMASADRIAVFGSKLLDISSLLPAGAESEFDKAGWQAVNLDGKVTGLPNHSSVYAAAYNVDYFDAAGLTAPKTAAEAWTWDELEEAARAIQSATDAEYGLQFGDPSFDGLAPFFYHDGGTLLNDDMTAAAVDNPAAVETLTWIADLHSDGVAAPGLLDGTSDGPQLFASGLSGIWLCTSNTKIPDLQTKMTKYGWDYMVAPTFDHPITQIVPVQWAAFDNGDKPDTVYEFMDSITSVDSAAAIASVSGTLPSRLAAADKMNWSAKPELVQFFLDYRNEAFDERFQTEAVSPIYGAARPGLLEIVAQVASGGIDPEDAASQMGDAIDEQIASAG